ncbi:MAG: hypothetical protein KC636_11195, partial [Myxococcales bacterium]|nr:hypothetical protein [Myxococcales bacterium]
LRHAKLTDASAQALATCEGLRGLRVLHLHGNAIGPEGARALAASKVLENLEILDLRGNRIRIEGARALASSPIVRGLEFLHLDPEDINNVDGLEALAASKQLPRDLVRLWRARRACVDR